MKKLILCLFILLKSMAQTNFTVSGYVKETGSGENIIGAVVYAPKHQIVAETNSYGFYSLTLPQDDSLRIVFSGDTYHETDTIIKLDHNVLLNYELKSSIDAELATVVITEKNSKISKEVLMSKIEVPVEQIKSIPALLGEKDVLKVIQLLPGVKRGSEGSMGFYVRGGGPDQNLIILDDAVVYNAQHLFGFFSIFNGDAIRNIELSKGGFPARYGGRLSSVLDMRMKDGHKEKLHGEAGIGILSSRLTLEGPIKKGKSSFLVSGRRTYFDLLTKPFQPAGTKFGYYFYDLNAKVNFVLSPKDKLFISSYLGRDIFYVKFKEDNNSTKSNLGWGNTTATARWNHIYNSKLFGNASFIFSNYKFKTGLEFEGDGDNAEIKYTSNISDIALKLDFDYVPNSKHVVKFGAHNTLHHFVPSGVSIKTSQASELNMDRSYKINALEAALFVEDVYSPSLRWKVNPGLRMTAFRLKDVTYKNLEPRLGVAYLMDHDWTLKGSYAKMNQYIHLLTNAGIGLPTDLWVPSTKAVKPQNSQQVALGIAKDLPKQNLQLSIEAYYKVMDRTVSYKEGKGFLNAGLSFLEDENNVWENIVTQGKGKSYGVEFLLQRKVGKLSGWIGYTLSWAKQHYADINNGKEFYAKYDARNDISMVAIYEINKGITISGTWVYNTGYPINPPISEYRNIKQNDLVLNKLKNMAFYQGAEYGPRNSVRMPSYHRFDMGVQFSKDKGSYTRVFEFSIYNVYSRQNPFFYTMGREYLNDGTYRSVLQQVSIFPIIPSVSWTFKF